MRTLLLTMCTLLATSLWAQLPFSFTGTAGDGCVPAQDPFIQTWPGITDPSSGVRVAWSATNATNDPVLLTVSVYRDAYVELSILYPAVVEHTFTLTAAPNGTSTGANIWPCAYNGFEQGRSHSVRVSGPAGTCTAFSLTVEDSPGAFTNDAEPNNSSSQFITAAPNTFYEGHLRYNNTTDADWYRIDLPLNGVLRIEFEGEQPSSSTTPTVEVRLSLTSGTIRYTADAPLGAERVPLATNIDVPCMGSEGVYNLRFLASGGCDVSYRFRYVVLPTAFPTDAEPNNGTPGSVGSPVAHDTYQDGQIGFEFQTGNDLFNIVPPFNGLMTIEVQAEHAGSTPGDMAFTLYTSAGTTIQAWNVTAGANGTPVTSTFTVPCRSSTTDYDIGINAITCGVSYRWKYTITSAVFANDLEPNNSSGGSTEAHNTWYEGQIGFDNQTDDDIYNLVPPFNGVMNIEVEAEHANAAAGTLEVTLFTTAGTLIEQWIVPVGASGAPASSLLSRTCRSSTTDYDLRFRDVSCGTSYRWRYVMTPPVFANDPEPNNSTPGTPIVLANASQEGQIGFDNQTDDDYFAFTHPGGPWSITLSAEHAGVGEGSMNMVVINNPGTVFGTFTVPAGGSSTPLTNTFTIPSLPAGTIYRIRLSDVTCGVSYKLLCYDDDNDGVCNGTDLCANTPSGEGVNSSGCSCSQVTVDDGDACTLDACLNGDVTNTFQDADGDLTCDANDGCPNDPNKIAPGQCGCGVADTDSDGDLTADCNDGCPNDPNKIAPGICGCGTADTDSDGDGTVDCVDPCPNIPNWFPGQVCNDNNACTINDVVQGDCSCSGTYSGDTDSDGFCDAIDNCPTVPGQQGDACDDGNALTINDVLTAGCVCAGTPVSCVNNGDCNDNDPCTLDECNGNTCTFTPLPDSDNDGTCDLTDGCPNDPNKVAPGICGCGVSDADTDGDLTADCNDGCPNDPNKIAPGICGCGVSDADTDGDLTADCNDGCPNDPNKTTPGICGCGNPEPGAVCNDNNANTENDLIGANCVCAGTPIGGGCTTNELEVVIATDAASTVSYEVRVEGTNALAASGTVIPPQGEYTQAICLPDGCYYLVVSDNGGDGIAGGGYLLRLISGQRVIDNGGNMTVSPSQIAGGEGFCLPLGVDRLISASCDRMDWRTAPCNAEYVVANANTAVSGQFNVTNATSGYEMWWYNPNGGYSFKRFQSHSTANGLPVSATRACHFRINAWSGNQLQQGVLYNVKVRGRVAGDFLAWGPACRFMINNALAQCPLTGLNNIAGQFFSCGVTRSVSSGSYVFAVPTRRLQPNCTWLYANRYQFRFRIVSEGFELVKTNTTYNVNTLGLSCGKTYDVDVRVSFNGGLTWCASGNSWGASCTVSTTACPGGGNLNMAQEGGASELRMYPNPNRGDQIFVNLTGIDASVETVSVDIYDAFGKRVSARTIATQDGFVNTIMQFNGELAAGLYTVSITAGEQQFNERLVVQP